MKDDRTFKRKISSIQKRIDRHKRKIQKLEKKKKELTFNKENDEWREILIRRNQIIN